MVAAALDPAPTGLPPLGALAWGAHVSHFYRNAEDIRELVVPYVAAGLENHERCVWMTAPPFGVEEARRALAERVGDLDAWTRSGQLEIVDYEELRRLERGDPDADVRGWLERETRALRDGYR